MPRKLTSLASASISPQSVAALAWPNGFELAPGALHRLLKERGALRTRSHVVWKDASLAAPRIGDRVVLNGERMRSADLGPLLTAFVPADDREADFKRRMLELAGRANPFVRTDFSPGHFTASAFVLSEERDALALIFHKKLELWLQPGGHIEPSDATVFEAARREVTEETGLGGLELAHPGLFDLDIHAIPARAEEAAHEHFDVRALFTTTARAFSASDEVEGARWVRFDEVAALSTDESVQRAVRKIALRARS